MSEPVRFLLQCLAAGYYAFWYRDRQPDDSLRYRTFGPRFWAGWIDGLVFAPLGWLTEFLIAPAAPAVRVSMLVLDAILYFTYSVVAHGLYGQTVGKWLCGVEVLDVSESKLSMRQALWRDGVPIVLTFISFVVLFPELLERTPQAPKRIHDIGWMGRAFIWSSGAWYLLELLTMLTNDKRRAVHDFIASSVVVRTETRADIPPTFGIGPNWRAMPPALIQAVLETLNTQQVEHALVGGLALDVLDVGRVTKDVDLLIQTDAENLARLRRALKTIWNDTSIVWIDADAFLRQPLVRYVSPEGLQIDLHSRVGNDTTLDALPTEVREYSGVAVRVATPSALYKLARDDGRTKARQDAAVLRKTFEIEPANT